ncbi:hypothetical protein CHS0354_010984 [Potamilus streckersoni]|uniref:ornithine decarboxylase n=1 Tax=Potamilus streckersoni TaxID=2493646 RepID=A0AAE0TLV5_9BIVA|nr:hypothetical protein CHS0354_010984 [Potamilus streckersoni]
MKTWIGNNCVVDLLPHEKTCKTLVEEKIAHHEREDKDEAFLLGDLGDIINKYNYWVRKLPRIVPFYAVKCNDDHAVLKVLSDLGASFDCASKAEIEKVLKLGVQPIRIIYANPCKQTSYIRYAAKHNVSLMTFDSEGELLKFKDIYPGAKLVLRIFTPNNFKVQCELGMKFGCQPSEAPLLLQTARNLGLDVVGVSFHVGSGCREARAFAVAIQQARQVFDIGLGHGFNMNLLDIGGGFPGQKSAPISFDEIVKVLNEALELYFPTDEGVRIIAEPGRYMVASAFTLGVNIIGKHVNASDQHGENSAPVSTSQHPFEHQQLESQEDGLESQAHPSSECSLTESETVSQAGTSSGTTHQNLLPGGLGELKLRFQHNKKYVPMVELEMQKEIAEAGFIISDNKQIYVCQYCESAQTFDSVIAGCDLWTMHHKDCNYLKVHELDEQRQNRVDDSQAVPTRILVEPPPAQSEQSEDGEPLVCASERAIKYCINDGVFGSFSCCLYDHTHVEVSLPGEPEMGITYECSLWGPTCDSLDCILAKTRLPELKIGDWLYFLDMGAYTMAAQSTFKGTTPPVRYYYCLAEVWHEIYPIEQRKEQAWIRQTTSEVRAHPSQGRRHP